ncbi:MAG: hypothetical protein J6W80_00990 [Kiritimatiellae bacterium]|nr:hypothetical protein [Kiritimatiellia bacterium]
MKNEKRLAAVAVAIASLHSSFYILHSFAAPEKCATVKFAGLDGQIACVTAFGEMIGNSMVGTLATAKLLDNPLVKFFGPARKGADISGFLYADMPEGAKEKNFEGAFEDNDFTVIYPVKRTKAEFLAAYPDAVETNGVIYVEDAIEPFDETYIAFTEDGKWAVASGKEKYLKLAMEEIAFAERPIGAPVAEFEALPPLVKALPALMVANIKDDEDINNKKAIKEFAELIKMVESFRFSLSVDKKGIDFLLATKPVEGTPLASSFDCPLPEKPFSAFPAGSAVASSYAKNTGINPDRFKGQAETLVALLKKHGVKTDFVSVKAENSITAIDLDIAAEIAYVNGEGKDAFKKLDAAKLIDEFYSQTFESSKPVWNAEGSGCAFSVKDVPVEPSLDERLAYTVPDCAAKKPCTVTVVSLYPTMKLCSGKVLECLPKDKAGDIEPVKALFATLPPPGKGATVAMAWKDGAEFDYLVRIHADEVKGLSSVVNVVVGFAMQAALSRPCPQFECDDDTDCCDDDDEDADADDAGDED